MADGKSKRSGRSTAKGPSSSSQRVSNQRENICPICLDLIWDATDEREGQDSIFCEGMCKSWLHRRCAGLSKKLFDEISDPCQANIPFHCPHCRLATQGKALANLQSTVESLVAETSALRKMTEDLKQTISVSKSSNSPFNHPSNSSLNQPSNNSLNQPSNGSLDQPSNSSLNQPSTAIRNSESRKFNVVVRGIKECPKGTHWRDRTVSDCNSALATLSKLVPSLNDMSVRDNRRLGKYSESNPYPRPLLVTLSRASDLADILAKRNYLAKEKIFIKPDQSPEQRSMEAILLKERRSLINSKINTKQIKIRGPKLYIGNRVYGRVTDGVFTSHLSLEDLAPQLTSIGTPDKTVQSDDAVTQHHCTSQSESNAPSSVCLNHNLPSLHSHGETHQHPTTHHSVPDNVAPVNRSTAEMNPSSTDCPAKSTSQ